MQGKTRLAVSACSLGAYVAAIALAIAGFVALGDAVINAIWRSLLIVLIAYVGLDILRQYQAAERRIAETIGRHDEGKFDEYGLTNREEVLTLLLQGRRATWIAQKLYISRQHGQGSRAAYLPKNRRAFPRGAPGFDGALGGASTHRRRCRTNRTTASRIDSTSKRVSCVLMLCLWMTSGASLTLKRYSDSWPGQGETKPDQGLYAWSGFSHPWEGGSAAAAPRPLRLSSRRGSWAPCRPRP